MATETELVLRLVLAALIGGLIGLEREIVHRPAGIRTHMLVSLGACLLTVITLATAPAEIARTMAGIVTGIGFLGAGTIFKSKSDVHGLTTAASIWVMAAIGVAIGLGYYLITLVVAGLALFILYINRFDFFRDL